MQVGWTGADAAKFLAAVPVYIDGPTCPTWGKYLIAYGAAREATICGVTALAAVIAPTPDIYSPLFFIV